MNTTWHHSVRDNIQLLQVGDLLSEQTNKEVLEEVNAQLKQGYTNYVIDLSSANYINSVGLNLLIIIKERAKKVGGEVILAHASPLVVKLLKMTKLYPIFELRDSIEEAFAVFSNQNN